MPVAKITKRFVDALAAPSTKQTFYDAELKGFGLWLLKSGAGAYFVEYRPDGGGRRINKRRMKVGRLGELTPDEARKQARLMLAEVCKGEDPLAERQTRRRELKVQELIDQWDKDNPPGRRSGLPLNPRTKTYMLARLRHHIVPLIGSKRVSEVTVGTVNDVIRQISQHETKKSGPSAKKRGRIRVHGGPGAARKAASDLSIVMAYAVEKEIIASNPVTGARKPAQGKRHTYLTLEQVAALASALTRLEAQGANKLGIAIVRLLMLTGARPSEIEGLKWSEVDFRDNCLRLSKTKTGFSRRPLSQEAIAILQTVPRAPGATYVFPATTGKGHYISSKQVWNDARELAKLPHVVRYEARHMVATLALAEGHDLAAVAAMMGHAGPRTTLAIYAHVLDQNSTRAASSVGAKVASMMSLPSNDAESAPKVAARDE